MQEDGSGTGLCGHGIIEAAAGQAASKMERPDGKNGWSEFILKLERQPAPRTSCNSNGYPNIDYVLRR